MTVIRPGGPIGSTPRGIGSRTTFARMTMTARVVWTAALAWVLFVALALPIFSVGEAVVAVLAPVFGLIAGAWKGFGLGIGIAAHIFAGPVILPAVSAVMFGVAAGLLSGWLGRARFRSEDRVSRSFISSLFSPEILEGNAAGFVAKLIVGTAVGVALSVIVSSVGMFDPTTPIGGNWQLILGGGPGDYPFGDSLISLLLFIFCMLGALLVACGIAGLCVGGLLGGAIGAGFSTIGVSAFLNGASEGLAFRFFAPYRPKDERSGRLIYLLVGAGVGAAEGLLVGFVTGAILFIAQVARLFG